MPNRNFSTHHWLIAAETVCFLLIAAFCFGAWLTAPRKIFSLREALDRSGESNVNDSLSIDDCEWAEVNLPPDYFNHFNARRLNAVKIDRTNRLTLHLDSIVNLSGETRDRPLGLAYSAVCLNERPGQYRTSIRYPNTRRHYAKDSPRVPLGGTVLRNCFGWIDPVVPGTRLRVESVDPGTSGFLCDFTLYSAPGLTIWANGE